MLSTHNMGGGSETKAVVFMFNHIAPSVVCTVPQIRFSHC